MSKLGSACYAMRAIKTYMAQGTLRMIYFSYFHSVMTYGLIFWGNSPHSIHTLGYRKGQLELLLTLGVEIHVGNYLRKWKFCPFNHSLFFLFCCS
jgi:hypothetical protein